MKHLVWKIAATLAGVVALGVAVNTATDRSQESLTRALLKNDMVQCERGNRVRAFIRADSSASASNPTARRARADKLFPILDCEATNRTGQNVALPLSEQEAYIRETIPSLP